jgi:citrate lyase subunit beta/citryl-CoA lyase
MTILIRRSNLLVRLADAEAVRSAWRHNADAITLDLEGADSAARSGARAAIEQLARGAAEVFVKVDRETLGADLETAVWPGLHGVLMNSVSSFAQVQSASENICALEAERGLRKDSLQLIVVLDSAAGVWDVRAIVKASARISQVFLDEAALAAELGITPVPSLDPFVYARGRVVVEAIAAKVMPVGIAYPLSVYTDGASAEDVHAMAVKGKNLGFKGVLCPDPAWVAAVNGAFTPTRELVTYNQRVREAFAAGVAAGTAAVPLDGRMIDVPVDEWAIVVLETAEACARRDAEKTAATSGRR